MRQFFNIVVLLLICFAAYSQTYPVQVNTQLTPPFTPYLSDYITPGAQKLMVQIRLNDPTLTDYTCKLRVTIEGVNITIRSSQAFLAKAQPITIQGGGIPEMFYGEDLAEYFNPNALDFSGMSRSQYERGAKLPEGVYRFTIEVLDYHRGTVVSNAGTAMAWIILNDPPILNMPRKDTKIKIVDPNNIAFSWTPRHTGSPNAAFTTEYIFRLVEIWPLNRNPYDAFLSQPVLYETTTNLTQIAYGPAEPAMLSGRKYAWQVQAVDIDSRDLFKNQGKSEVFVFQYGDALGVPSDIYLQSANESSLTVGWDAPENAQGEVTYRVQYRPHSDRKTETWYEVVASDVFGAIGQLQASAEYEVQVRTEQGNLFSEYSAPQIFKTDAPGSSDFACSADVTPPVPPVGAPIRTLNVGSTIHAAGFDVVVKSVTASGSSYTGEGLIVVPWFKLAKVKATFKNISVNDQLWLTAGEIKTVWNPDSKFLIKVPDKNIDSTQNAPKMNSGESVTTTGVDSLIEITGAAIVAVTKDSDGNIVVSTTDGERKVLPKGTSYAIVDGVGNGYVVDKNGDVVKTTSAIAREAAEKGNRKYNLAMHFEKGSGKYGFDEKQKEELDQFYQKLDNGKSIGWKAVTRSDYDLVDAVLDGKDYDSKKIHFEVGSTPVTPTGTSDGRFNLNIAGKAEGTTEELLAYYSASDTSKQEILGKLNLISYDKITRNLVVVPVNMDADKIPFDLQPQQLGQELSRIYNQSIAGWQVSMAQPIKAELKGAFDDGQTNAFSNYTDDMVKVITAYGKIQDNTYYIFLIDEKPVSDRPIQGRMPRSKQAGFIFTSNHSSLAALTNTIAHELGHGAFNLQHTFKEFSLTEGSTDNLMDYTNGAGEKLYKYQWDHIHDPQRVIGLFEDDEDSEMTQNALFWTPSGSVIFVSSNIGGVTDLKGIESQNFPNGALAGFKADGHTYYAKFKDDKFWGYFDGENPYQDNTQKYLDLIKGPNQKEVSVISRVYEGNCVVTDYSNMVPIGILRIGDYKSGMSTTTNEYFTQRTKKLASAAITNCDKEVDTYENLKPFGKLVFDTNKLSVPEADRSILVKIASLGDAVGEDAYNSFVYKQKNDGNLFLSGENHSAPFTRETFLSTYENFKKYSEAISRLKYFGYPSSEELIKDVRENFQVTKGSDNLFVFPSDPKFVQLLHGPFQGLTIARKKELIDVIHDADFAKLQNVGKDVDAGYILNAIFVTTKNNSISDQRELISYINAKNYLKHFMEGMYLFQYETFFNSVMGMVLRSYPAPPLKLEGDQTKFLTFDGSLLQLNSEGLTSTGVVHLEVKRWFDESKYIIESDPYEYITVEFVNDVDFGPGFRFIKGQKVKLPAIWAYQLFWKDTKEGRWATARVTAEVALTVVGVGEIAIAMRTMRAGRAVAGTYGLLKGLGDLGFGLADLYISNSNTLTEAQMKKWNTFFMLYSFGSLSASAIEGLAAKLGKNHIDNADDWAKFDNEFPDDELNKLRNESEYAEYIDEIPTGNWATLLGSLKSSYPNVAKRVSAWQDAVLQDKFLAHFGSHPDVLKHLDESNNIDDLILTWQQIATDYQNLASGLGNLSDVNKIKFLDDFAGVPATTLKSLASNVESFDAWKVFNNANLGDVVRKSPTNIEGLSKALRQNGYDASYFENLLKSKTDPQKFIDDYLSKLGNDGKFIDTNLENDYANYLVAKRRQGKPPRDRSDWNEASNYMKYDSPTARGNNFNRKAWDENWYPAWEVQLDNGRFMDGYNPYTKQVVSRKATDLEDISEEIFIKHLDELRTKYAPPRKITTKKKGTIYDDLRTNPDLPLDAELILEIPESNRSFFDIDRYIKLAESKGIKLSFKPE